MSAWVTLAAMAGAVFPVSSKTAQSMAAQALRNRLFFFMAALLTPEGTAG